MKIHENISVTFFQGFLGIILGLGLATLANEFVDEFVTDRILLWNISLANYLRGFSGILLLVKFYYANLCLIEYLRQQETSNSRTAPLTFDFCRIASQGIAFAVLGLFINNGITFRWLIVFIYFADFLWNGLSILVLKYKNSDHNQLKFSALVLVSYGLMVILLATIQILYLWGIFSHMICEIAFFLLIVLGTGFEYHNLGDLLKTTPKNNRSGE